MTPGVICVINNLPSRINILAPRFTPFGRIIPAVSFSYDCPSNPIVEDFATKTIGRGLFFKRSKHVSDPCLVHLTIRSMGKQ